MDAAKHSLRSHQRLCQIKNQYPFASSGTSFGRRDASIRCTNDNNVQSNARSFYTQTPTQLFHKGKGTRRKTLLNELSLKGVADYIKAGKVQSVIVLSGAGISVAAGIPDFRSPGTGLYDNLHKYDLPYPSAIFELPFLARNPKPFFHLAKVLYPGSIAPTPCHYFVSFLNEKGILLRNYTQNIDTLERVAMVPGHKLVEAHGSFSAAHCISCRKEYPSDFVKTAIFADKIPTCEECSGIVKPDIVFFGESLPERFFTLLEVDFPMCDLLIVMGSSLVVQPFASLKDHVNGHVPRLLLNMEEVLGFDHTRPLEEGGRDVVCLQDCQKSVLDLVDHCGWKEEFHDYMHNAVTKLGIP